MDKWQKLHLAFSCLVLIWLASYQARLSSRRTPSRIDHQAVAALNSSAPKLPSSWKTLERPPDRFRADLASKTNALLLSTSEVKGFLDRKVRQDALNSVAPFDAKLKEIETASEAAFTPVHTGPSGVVVGSSVRGRTGHSSSHSSSSSFSHK